MPEFSLVTVRWLAWGTLALVLLLMLGLLLLRWVRWRSAPKKAAFRQRWSAVLLHCAVGEAPPGQLPALKPSERWPFVKLWLHFQLSLKGPSRDRLAALAHAMDCNRVAMDKFTSRHPAEQLMATLALGFLKQAQAQAALLEQLGAESQQSALHAARALLEINADAHAHKVTEMLLSRQNLDLPLTAVLLKPFRSRLSQVMASRMPVMPADASRQNHAPAYTAAALAWLRLARVLSLQVPGESLTSLLTQTDDIDLLIATISLMQGEHGTAALSGLAQHADWRVRAQVAQAMGRVGRLDDADLLVRMSTDPQWWVRYRATQALLRIPGLSQSQAQSRIQMTGDRFAANMLESIISEREAVA